MRMFFGILLLLLCIGLIVVGIIKDFNVAYYGIPAAYLFYQGIRLLVKKKEVTSWTPSLGQNRGTVKVGSCYG